MAPLEEPFQRFDALLARAAQLIPVDPNAMMLATVGDDGQPTIRTVLLKGVDPSGFVFFTNLESRKGRELARHPLAALNFFWPPLGVQVRVEGAVEPVSAAESDAYFATRPRGSQLGAWASAQSEPLPSRAVLEARLAEVTARFEGQPVPRPPRWGGQRLVPRRIEFWQAHPDRLHHRELYRRSGEGWEVSLLYP